MLLPQNNYFIILMKYTYVHSVWAASESTCTHMLLLPYICRVNYVQSLHCQGIWRYYRYTATSHTVLLCHVTSKGNRETDSYSNGVTETS